MRSMARVYRASTLVVRGPALSPESQRFPSCLSGGRERDYILALASFCGRYLHDLWPARILQIVMVVYLSGIPGLIIE